MTTTLEKEMSINQRLLVLDAACTMAEIPGTPDRVRLAINQLLMALEETNIYDDVHFSDHQDSAVEAFFYNRAAWHCSID